MLAGSLKSVDKGPQFSLKRIRGNRPEFYQLPPKNNTNTEINQETKQIMSSLKVTFSSRDRIGKFMKTFDLNFIIRKKHQLEGAWK
jgi:hypothetical protein